ncbi:uncharacterized protein LOC116348130 [Contarinia nasturtii]|uniref:uncharacterized protein LOC116348130 n=1 Tax=Contarinia nasturtii TaxID=265458 RepID=UPI0012D41244|nr:uncharacterized protein LOC116348130 [Contarinia nasturtii]
MLFQLKLCIFIYFLSRNIVKGYSTNVECFDCIAKRNEKECIKEPNKEINCTSEKYCYVYVNENAIFVRGCFKNGDPFVESKEFCEKHPDKCSLCSDKSFCNGKAFFEEHCYNENYKVDEFPSVQSSKTCPIKSLNSLGCYHMEKNNSVTKGCMSDLDEATRLEYEVSEDCVVCHEEKCNMNVVRHRICYDCNEEPEANCAEPQEVTKTTDVSKKSSSCLVGIDKNGFTHRMWGTNEKHDMEKFPNGFTICYDDSCNNIIFPSGRLKCLQCQGDENCNDLKENLEPKVCEIYSSQDECYSYFDKERNTFRGCWSDRHESKKLCEQNDAKCIKCKESGCNKHQPSSANVCAIASAKFFISIAITISLLIRFT